MEALEHRQRLLARSVGMWANRAVGSAWNTWRGKYLDTIAEQVRRLAVMRQVAGYWGNRALGAAFNSWKACYQALLAEKAENEAKIRKGLGQWMNRQLAAAWNTWRQEYTAFKQAWQAKVDQLRQVAGLWMHAQMGPAWHTVTVHWPGGLRVAAVAWGVCRTTQGTPAAWIPRLGWVCSCAAVEWGQANRWCSRSEWETHRPCTQRSRAPSKCRLT